MGGAGRAKSRPGSAAVGGEVLEVDGRRPAAAPFPAHGVERRDQGAAFARHARTALRAVEVWRDRVGRRAVG